MNVLTWLQDNRDILIVAVAILAALVGLQRAIDFVRRLIRRRRPTQLNPKLQRYGGPSDEELAVDRAAAERIIATSSTSRIAGYQIRRQIEAVYVEGYRTPEDATSAIKAAAGKLSANGIVNLSLQRTAAGRCTAQGDAVMIKPLGETAQRREPPPEAPKRK